MTLQSPVQTTRWTLTEFGQGEHQQRTIELPLRPLIVGRASDADVTIPSSSVSKRHASLDFAQDHMIVQDLGSTNGTHLNGKPIECSTVQVGDLLQFANALYRVGRRGEAISDATREEGILPWANTLLLFDRLMSERAVMPNFQPIITLNNQQTVGYELLARSALEGLTSPALLFGAAERLGQQAALSELMREEGLRVCSNTCVSDMQFFLNTHPSEVITDRLVESLRNLRADYPAMRIVIEIHEAGVTDLASMKMFRQVLAELDMQLSYDDFGAGQGRLLELGEVPPDVLKFDMQLIRAIDTASAARQELLSSLVRIAVELGTVPLAEGVETEGEHRVCQQMGFQLGQGFHYGHPTRLSCRLDAPQPA